MFKYQCPECEVVMKRATKVEEGKKIKCPKCESIFKAVPIDDPDEEKAREQKSKTAQKKAAVPNDEDDDEGGTYVVAEERADTAADVKAKEVSFGSLRDKYPKSKRGPAMAKTVAPSNLILMVGALTGIAALVYLCWGIWPFIFSEQGPTGAAARNRALLIASAVLLFACAALICHGGSKLHTLESQNWAMAGSILCILFGVPPFGIAAGVWGIVTLKDEEVLAGFEETAEKRDDF
jgi:DNA-directed RNA polymerase subunit M/transcription elongation factor TFIIS